MQKRDEPFPLRSRSMSATPRDSSSPFFFFFRRRAKKPRRHRRHRRAIGDGNMGVLSFLGTAIASPTARAAVSVALALATLLIVRVLWILRSVGRASRARGPGESAVTLAVLGSGGHTSEMLNLLSALDADRYRPITFMVADTDGHSRGKAEKQYGGGAKPGAARGASGPSPRFVQIPRSREVHMGWATTVFMTLKAWVVCIVKVWSVRPELLICNGPGTCIPVILAIYVWKVLGCMGSCRVIFVESFCRVESLSMSGKIAYLLADDFLVQWPGLLDKYPRARYVGRLV